MGFDWTDTPRLALPAGACPPMQQSAGYGAACRALGTGVRCLSLAGGLGAAQVLVRRWPLFGDFALLSRGPVWAPSLAPADRRAALAALLARLRHGFRGVVTTPDAIDGADPLARSGWLAMVTGGHVARLDLGPPPEALRLGLHGKWRNRLVRAEASGLAVRHGAMPPDPGHWLLATETAQARARGYRRLPARFTLAWVGAAGQGATRLFVAERAGRPVAAMLFLLHPPGASYHIGWAGPEGRESGAHNLLLWQAMLWLRARGFAMLELGTLDTETTPGLARFKLGSGAGPVPLGATRMAAPGTALVARLAEGRAVPPP
jgi:hypothetical protein